jgi:hypothetical protein
LILAFDFLSVLASLRWFVYEVFPLCSLRTLVNAVNGRETGFLKPPLR